MRRYRDPAEALGHRCRWGGAPEHEGVRSGVFEHSAPTSTGTRERPLIHRTDSRPDESVIHFGTPSKRVKLD